MKTYNKNSAQCNVTNKTSGNKIGERKDSLNKANGLSPEAKKFLDKFNAHIERNNKMIEEGKSIKVNKILKRINMKCIDIILKYRI